MTHPQPEEWMAYLYREAGSRTRSRLRAHLAGCESCRTQLAQWRSVRRRLDAWKLPNRPSTSPLITRAFMPVLRWAAAAAVMVALGFGLGRSSAPTQQDLRALRQELRTELAQLLKSEVGRSAADTLAAANQQADVSLRQFVEVYHDERTADHRAVATALSRLDAARTADFLSLRKDLETVALNSDVSLRQTHQQLLRLADYSQAEARITPN